MAKKELLLEVAGNKQFKTQTVKCSNNTDVEITLTADGNKY